MPAILSVDGAEDPWHCIVTLTALCCSYEPAASSQLGAEWRDFEVDPAVNNFTLL